MGEGNEELDGRSELQDVPTYDPVRMELEGNEESDGRLRGEKREDQGHHQAPKPRVRSARPGTARRRRDPPCDAQLLLQEAGGEQAAGCGRGRLLPRREVGG